MRLTVATCQFPTTAKVDANAEQVAKLMLESKAQGADVAHFPEACLSGYAGADLTSYEGFDWQRLQATTLELIA